ncbi:MAG TPA: hypothetical protein H9862_00065 [Candidatus Akkermansia intestinigallinarum]|uniref:Uncharacterized protein n=1 Tax=Candidatus Akkermansia intestinigallinarum TaxID=2838431 RepID=A0A9D1V9B2_9BACT|nr:hypothetical protein [Candidatus Akkermansia intestinigallinarum]
MSLILPPLLACLSVLASLVPLQQRVGPPSEQSLESDESVARREALEAALPALLPPEERELDAARTEARRLADTAFRASAGISRLNGVCLSGWAGNILINTGLYSRGLCWHYQHDLFRELRRLKLSFYRLGCCVRDKGKYNEHNCVYIAAADTPWPRAVVLDAWAHNGRLSFEPDARTLDEERWQDQPELCSLLGGSFPEEHGYPCEYWFSVRGRDGVQVSSTDEKAVGSRQYELMQKNIKRGRREHPGKLTNY